MFAQVAVPHGAPDALTYAVPGELEALTRPGVRVRVPLRRRMVTGLVVAVAPSSELDPEAIRPIAELLDPEPVLPLHLLELADFVAGYYRCPLGDTLAAMLPASLLRADAEEVGLTLRGATADPASLPPRQAALLEALRAAGRLRLATLLARAGATGRSGVDALAAAGLAELLTVRRDRAPRVEVAAVRLAERPLEELLAACGRAPARRRATRLAGRAGAAGAAERAPRRQPAAPPEWSTPWSGRGSCSASTRPAPGRGAGGSPARTSGRS